MIIYFYSSDFYKISKIIDHGTIDSIKVDTKKKPRNRGFFARDNQCISILICCGFVFSAFGTSIERIPFL